jgi:hypothetical protein
MELLITLLCEHELGLRFAFCHCVFTSWNGKMRAIVVFPRFSIAKMYSKMQVKKSRSVCSLCVMWGRS